MKTILPKILAFYILIISATLTSKLYATEDSEYITISGFVKDSENNKGVEYVNIFLTGTNINTVTNADGYYSLKIKKQDISSFQLKYSHIGYYNLIKNITTDNSTVNVSLKPYIHQIKEISVDYTDPKKIVLEAINRISKNYSSQTNLLTGFYRETIRKKNKYIDISEAVVNVYKTPYDNDIRKDFVEIHKGRRLISQKPSDTLSVKFIGGPTLSTQLDVVKNHDIIFNEEELEFYRFVLEDYVMIDEQLHYVIDFKPAMKAPYPLFLGKLYINKESLTFSEIAFEYDMSERKMLTEILLKKKPIGMKFNPKSLSYYIRYSEQNGGKSSLNYIRTEFNFECDWKRRLFSTNYTVVSEMVITDIDSENVEKIHRANAFKQHYSLTDKIAYFSDDNFWADYNIIEPTESLLSAVNKLKKQHR